MSIKYIKNSWRVGPPFYESFISLILNDNHAVSVLMDLVIHIGRYWLLTVDIDKTRQLDAVYASNHRQWRRGLRPADF